MPIKHLEILTYPDKRVKLLYLNAYTVLLIRICDIAESKEHTSRGIRREARVVSARHVCSYVCVERGRLGCPAGNVSTPRTAVD